MKECSNDVYVVPGNHDGINGGVPKTQNYPTYGKKKEKIIKNGKPQDVSRQMTKAIIEKYPFIKDRTPKFTDEELKQGYKDIADIWELKYSKVR